MNGLGSTALFSALNPPSFWVGNPAPLGHDPTDPGFILAQWKAILTTILLFLAFLQVLEQAVLRDKVRLRIDKKVAATLHRLGGIVSLEIAQVVLGLCLYAAHGQGYLLGTERLIAHAVLGGLATAGLLLKVLISNAFPRLLRWQAVLGVAIFSAILGVFLTGALPHFLGLDY